MEISTVCSRRRAAKERFEKQQRPREGERRGAIIATYSRVPSLTFCAADLDELLRISFSTANHMKYAQNQPVASATATKSSHQLGPPYAPNIQSTATANGTPKVAAATFMKLGRCCKYFPNLTSKLGCICKPRTFCSMAHVTWESDHGP